MLGYVSKPFATCHRTSQMEAGYKLAAGRINNSALCLPRGPLVHTECCVGTRRRRLDQERQGLSWFVQGGRATLLLISLDNQPTPSPMPLPREAREDR